MLVIIPLIFFAVLTKAFLEGGCSSRAAILRATVWAGVVVAVSTEGLSAVHALTPAGIVLAWILATGAASYYWYSRVRKAIPAAREEPRRRWPRIYVLYLLPALILLAIVTANALLDPFHIADVLYYHLPRVRFWLQNQTVAFYPAAFLTQLYMPPWAEYAGAHYMALTGTERGWGLIQIASMALCPAAVSGIVELLGFDALAQVLAAAFAFTIPQGAMEAYDLKNDYVCAFWVAAAVYFLLSASASRRISETIFAGAAIGLALLTKTTSILYLTPFIAMFVLKLVRRPTRIQARGIAAAVLSIAILNAPYWIRNYKAFGQPLGCDSADCDGSFRFRNDAMDLRTTVENIARNIGLHLGTENPALNGKIEGTLVGVIHAAGGDPNDPRSTWKNTRFAISPPVIGPDVLGNRWHLMLIAVAFAMLPFGLKTKARQVLRYAVCVAAGALLFCIVLRWQPWHSRLHLPLFVLGAPLVAVALSRWRYAQGILAAACLLLFAPVILDTYAYQLRAWASFAGLRRLEMPRAPDSVPGSIGARRIREWRACKRVGLDTAKAYVMEGSLLSILGVGTGGAYVRHINAGGPDDVSQYCAILCVACEAKPEQAARYRAAGFESAEEPGATLFYRSWAEKSGSRQGGDRSN